MNIGKSFKFVGVIYSYINIGSAIMGIFLWAIGIVFGTREFWTGVIEPKLSSIIGYIAYFIFLKAVVEPFLEKVVTDGDWVQEGWEPAWHFFSFVLELLYIPISLIFPISTVIVNLLIAIAMMVRPDILVFLRGLESLQFGHKTFTANCKAYVYRVRQFYELEEALQLRERRDAFLQADKDTIQNQIDELMQKKLESAKVDDWHNCKELSSEIRLLEEELEIVTRDIKKGTRAYYDFNEGDGLEEVEVMKVNMEQGDMTIRRVANRSFFRLEIYIERFGIFLATDARTVSTSEKYDRHLSWSKCKKNDDSGENRSSLSGKDLLGSSLPEFSDDEVIADSTKGKNDAKRASERSKPPLIDMESRRL